MTMYRMNMPQGVIREEKTTRTMIDSSSLTNEKDHHYFLNSADVCW